MTTPTPPFRSPLGGGAYLALSILLGVALGLGFDQPSLGFVIGLVVGLALLIAVTVVDRNRNR